MKRFTIISYSLVLAVSIVISLYLTHQDAPTNKQLAQEIYCVGMIIFIAMLLFREIDKKD